MKYFFSIVLLLILQGCIGADTSTTFNQSLTASNSQSEVIRLSFANTKQAPYYFILMSSNEDGDPRDLLKVRWVNPQNYKKQFNSTKSSLRFIINREKVITLLPISEPVYTGYDINTGLSEEETLYKIERSQIIELAKAKTVETELTGRNKVVIGKFNRWHSFRGFKNFLKDA